jgi:hypothetical protein
MEQLQLTVKPLLAGLDLRWQRVSVARWPALQHIADVDLLSLLAYRGEKLFKELPGRSHEGAPLLVFVPAWRFTDKGYGGVLRTLAGDYLGTLPSELTLAAVGYFLVKLAECRHA